MRILNAYRSVCRAYWLERGPQTVAPSNRPIRCCGPADHMILLLVAVPLQPSPSANWPNTSRYGRLTPRRLIGRSPPS